MQTGTQQSVAAQQDKPDSEIHNPYVVKAEPILNEQEAELAIDQIKKLDMIIESDHGEVKLEYEMKNQGNSSLKLKNSYMDIHVSGAIAKGQLKEVIKKWGLLDVIHKLLSEPGSKMDIDTVQPIKKLQLETFDGKKIAIDKGKVKVQLKKKGTM